MKMYKYIVAVGLLASVLSSCSEFLDVQPEGNATISNYFQNDQQAIDAVTALYQPLHKETSYGRDLFWEQGGACDIVWGRTRSYNTLATLNYTGDESPLSNNFNLFYELMAKANWVIEQLLDKQTASGLTDIETRSLGEAYFMRGMAHFIIAYRYGTTDQGVPFVRYEDFADGYDNSIPPQQASVVDNYEYIIEDMDNAIAYLPAFEDYEAADQGRAHQAAAVAYKAKVYAYWATWDESQWTNVISMVNSLETTYGRDLASSLDEVFSSDFDNFWNEEYIWSIPSTGGSNGGGSEFPGVILENKGWGYYNGWGQNKPSYDIYEEMLKDGEGNDRLVRSILEYNQEFEFWGETRNFYSTSDVEAGFMINKYMDPFKYADADEAGYVNTNGDWPTARINFPLIRFADMLLFRAEAYLMTGDAASAKTDLDRIRNRSNIASLDHTPTMADLYHERRCELAFEFTDHLFDLKRWNRSSDATIKALANAELNAHPRVRQYEDRSDPESAFVIADYGDYQNKATYQDYMMVFPYPSNQITKSNGALTQNAGY
ncbi:RagB/SusD family nutrient uptake outer membrane protein [Mangrovibacterium diazotrophicum]|uniref:Putative outer membrane starch-binding protein n=1 Tax=Mangrovibacterium diazotrophicum TaxID=1261403 RepID=A0A419VYF4_9BACT|nr:RagB/SusD family nutrient uptake outer membrane protein [Mangrovibacterium diazotrophicum]RKD88273.1 putative outer membrane starch-binding protein [Mangrovibacterium diazotrophicum]